MRRVVVLGSTGSGKTTFASELARRLGSTHIELDALYWEPGWTEAAEADLRERVAEAITADTWVSDGNYSTVRDLLWPAADTVVWLDLSFPVVFWQLTRRTLRRSLTGEDLWGTGNTERLRTHLFTRDSLFLWLFKTFRRRRREYPGLFEEAEHRRLQVHRLRSRGKMRRFLDAAGR